VILIKPAPSVGGRSQGPAKADPGPLLDVVGGCGQAKRPTAEQAKAMFFAEWNRLESLCKRRFPNDDNLAHQGMDHIVQKLQADEWRRLRTWQGQGRFSTYLLTLAARLLTDYSRTRFGHVRMPAWLAKQSDPVWQQAYRLVVVKGYSRRDAVNWLATHTIGREAGFVEGVVAKIQGSCSRTDRDNANSVSLDEVSEPATLNTTPEAEMRITRNELLECLRQLLVAPEDATDVPSERIAILVERLRPLLRLSNEDRLFLRLRHIDGVKMREIVRLLHLKEDPCKCRRISAVICRGPIAIAIWA